MRTKFLALMFVGLIGLTATPSAKAVFQITVTESGGGSFTVVDNNPGDTNPDAGQISVDPLLNAGLAFFQFANLGASSNQPTGVPFSTDSAELTQNGLIQRLTTGPATATITILASATDYNFPTGNPKTMTNSASDTFTNTSGADTRTFQGFFNENNGQDAMQTPSALLVFNPPAGAGPFSTSGNAPALLVTDPALPFSLTNQSVITLAISTSTSSLRSDQFTGSTVIKAAGVPEPATLSLLLMSVPALLGFRRLRKQG